jgi:hypothetical protein
MEERRPVKKKNLLVNLTGHNIPQKKFRQCDQFSIVKMNWIKKKKMKK